jgi:hypothetical protein
MKQVKNQNLLKLSLVVATLSLASCGGGGGAALSDLSQSLAVTGVAATGAPMANATLQIYG